MLGLLMKHEFARFLVVGTICALVNLVGGLSYQWLLEGTPYWVGASVTFGFTLGTIASYVLNKYVTFQVTDEKTWPEFVRFILVSIVSNVLSGVVADSILFPILAHVPWVSEQSHRIASIAHVLTIGIMILPNYFMIKYIAFARRTPKDNSQGADNVPSDDSSSETLVSSVS